MSERHWSVFVRVWALSTLSLFAVTWKLWGPATEFPQVALLPLAQSLPQSIDWIFGTVVGISLIGLTLVGGNHRISKTLFFCLSISLAAMFLLNQHRLQPWAWQTFIFSTLFAVAGACDHDRRRCVLVCLLGWILVSIYLYSAISKFDYQFLHSTGEEFLDGFLSLLGMSSKDWSAQQKLVCVSMFPIGEMVIGLGLLFRQTRKWATAAAAGLHLALILVLSPLGLGHQWAVLIWNAQFAFLVVYVFLVFKPEPSPTDDESAPTSKSKSFSLGLAMTIIVIVLPILKPIGWCDHWLAWGLYSPSNSRSELRIPATAVEQFPDQFQICIEPSDDTPGVFKVNLGVLSLNELSVPVYPQRRFQTAAALNLIESHNLESRAQVIEYSASNFWSGKRIRTEKSTGD